LLLLTFLSFAMAQDVPTYHNDNARTGQDLNEITLTPKNVNSSSFGRLFTISVEGKVDAQPLYAAGVAIPGQGTHNVLVVATEHDSVYAFDADTGALIWKVSMLRAGETPSDSRGCSQVEPEIDITSTPVIDRTRGPNGAIYLVAMSKDGSGNYFQRLHALDLATHAELLGGPKDIQAKYPGTGDNSDGTNVIFDARQYKERPGLLLLNGVCIRRGGPIATSRPIQAG
jgi:outer membrane protein assembly factor BamB